MADVSVLMAACKSGFGSVFDSVERIFIMGYRSTPGQRGLSLVDLLLTLSLVAIVLTVPFVMNWVNATQLERSKGALIQASHNARALAMRNSERSLSGHLSSSTPLAGIKLLPNSIVLVCINDPVDSNCREGGSNVEWRADLSRGIGVAVTINDQNEAIFGFDQAGTLLAEADFKVSKGTEYKTGHLY